VDTSLILTSILRFSGYKFDINIACDIHPLDRHSSSVLEHCEQGHFLLRLLFLTSPNSTPNNLIDRQLDQYCDKDSLSSLSVCHLLLTFYFVTCIFFLFCHFKQSIVL